MCALALLLGLMLLWVTTAVVVAAEPSAPPLPLVGGDPRSDGAGPGIIGSPFMILAAVVALGVVTALVTVVIARVARRG